MRRAAQEHVGLYGSVQLRRAFCNRCEGYAFVRDGRITCCETPAPEPSGESRRLSAPDSYRKRLSPSKKAQALKAQSGACFYCERQIGSHVMKNGRPVALQLEWDHLVPYSYSQDNTDYNYVAACHMCNGWKTDMVFQTVDEAKVYLAAKWAHFCAAH